MVSLFRFLNGYVVCELTSADPLHIMQMLNRKEIRLLQVVRIDELTIQFCCDPHDWIILKEFCQKNNAELRILRESGILFTVKTLYKRPVLTAGFFLILLFTFYVPSRVLFISVEGNQKIPDNQILEAADECGICFGASRRAVRSEKMKNALLSAVPELEWAGINTSGCNAIISVRERDIEEKYEISTGISSIVAVRDGYITDCTVTRGNALCAPGQVVKAGQILISGYTDCGICIQVTQADGEVYAQTSRESIAIVPSEIQIRTEKKTIKRFYSMMIGKKRINLWKDSGIWDTTCDRIYEEYYLNLPGGFSLPLGIAVETVTDWKTVSVKRAAEELGEKVKDYSRRTVLDQSVAGKILQEKHMTKTQDGYVMVKSRFVCSEMIGRVITEEIGDTNGKTG